MSNLFTVAMDDGDEANELESFPTHNEALDYINQQVDDWNHTDKWDKTRKRLAMVITENGLELEIIEKHYHLISNIMKLGIQYTVGVVTVNR